MQSVTAIGSSSCSDAAVTAARAPGHERRCPPGHERRWPAWISTMRAALIALKQALLAPPAESRALLGRFSFCTMKTWLAHCAQTQALQHGAGDAVCLLPRRGQICCLPPLGNGASTAELPVRTDSRTSDAERRPQGEAGFLRHSRHLLALPGASVQLLKTCLVLKSRLGLPHPSWLRPIGFVPASPQLVSKQAPFAYAE